MAACCKSVSCGVVSRLSSLRPLTRLAGEGTLLPVGAKDFHSSAILDGGRPKSFWRKKRHPANTRLNHELEEKIKERKAYGGHKKMKALRIQNGTFTLKSCDVNIATPIVSVVHSFANTSHVDRQVIVKGSIVQLDVSPFKSWYDSELNATKENPNTDIKDHQSSHISEETKEMLDSGILFAQVDTRPGQVGACNGYILEGQELETLKSNLNLSKNP